MIDSKNNKFIYTSNYFNIYFNDFSNKKNISNFILLGNGFYLRNIKNDCIIRENEKWINNYFDKKFLEIIYGDYKYKNLIDDFFKYIENNNNLYSEYLIKNNYLDKIKLFSKLNFILERNKKNIIKIIETNKLNFEENIWDLFFYIFQEIGLLFFSTSNLIINNITVNKIKNILTEIYSELITDFNEDNFKNKIKNYSKEYKTFLALLYFCKLFVSYVYVRTIKNHFCFENNEIILHKNNETFSDDKILIELLNKKYEISTTNYTRIINNDEYNEKINYLHGKFFDNYTDILFWKDIKDKIFFKNLTYLMRLIIQIEIIDDDELKNIELKLPSNENNSNSFIYESIKNISIKNTDIYGFSIYGDQLLIDYLINSSEQIYIDCFNSFDNYNWDNQLSYYNFKYNYSNKKSKHKLEIRKNKIFLNN